MQNSAFKKFAIADDDADDSELFIDALAEIDPAITCDQASNGKLLLEKLQKKLVGLPDIIFLDINMPEMNGWECLAAIKENSTLSRIPVVMYSTSSTQRDKQTAEKLGANFFFTKPDSFRVLKTFLEKLIMNPEHYNIPAI